MHNFEQDHLNATLERLRDKIRLETPNNPLLSGWATYSQCDEDGIIRECLSRISKKVELSKTFIEIGCSNGTENNTHQLLLDGYSGFWVDGDIEKIQVIENQLGGLNFNKLCIHQSFVTKDNIVSLVERALRFLDTNELDFFSLDVDGNDIHLLPMVFQLTSPKLICVEYNAKFVPPSRLAMDYRSDHTWAGDDYFGASLQSWVETLTEYSLVCCNLSGANAFFVRNDLIENFTLTPINKLYQPPRYWLTSCSKGHNASLKWLKQELRKNIDLKYKLIKANTPRVGLFDFAIHADNDQFISGDLERDRIWEAFETEIFCRLCRHGDFILDLGANIGWYTVIASRLIGEEGRVISFEPDKTNLTLLKKNVAMSGDVGAVKLMNIALGDREENAKLFISENNLGDHRLFCDGTLRESINVQVRTLDSLFAKSVHKPTIVKSDTQGSEARILRGAANLFKEGWRPILILEFWPFGLVKAGDDPLELWKWLVSLEYSLYELSEGYPKLVPLTEDRLHTRINSDISPVAMGFINLLCLPNKSGRLEFIKDFIEVADQ
ncbi:MAG: FkbM family methyltransferase [Methylococcaceae bacterium]